MRVLSLCLALTRHEACSSMSSHAITGLLKHVIT
jgi:hypothetical protein